MTSSPRMLFLREGKTNRVVENFLKRPAFDAEAERAATETLARIRSGGAQALVECARRFDGVELSPSRLRVTEAEFKAAAGQVDRAFKTAVREARTRIRAFARAGLRRDWSIQTPGGGQVGERFIALDRVGVYVPGGQAPLASTALMTAALAQTAGVPEIVACTPCRKDASIDPHVLFALRAAGATEVYRLGGIQAIGLMAYGTNRIRKVRKIVGPGGAYVTAAKRHVYGHVALDLVAGPSEIAILADAKASARCVAADLLSQIEHGTGHEKALLATDSPALARAVQKECVAQAAGLSRADFVFRVMNRGMLIAVTETLQAGMDLCNRFAPEHFELLVERPRTWVRRVRAAGAVFLGPWSPESAGDFVAGPSHVLPTGGAAAMFSGLTADDFRRRTSVIAFTRRDLEQTLPAIETFGRVEQLDGHARSARMRFES